jgi:IclR family acetate operon transcriptional repressor
MVKSSLRTCQILKLVGERRGGMKHSEVSKTLKIPSSSLSGLLTGLVRTGFLTVDEESQRYSIGPEVVALAGAYLDGLELVDISGPVVRQLASDTGESVAVGVRNDTEIMIVCKRDSAQAIRRTIQIGQRAPMYATATGKAILAHMSTEEADRLFDSIRFSPLTGRTIKDAEALRTELAEVQSSGFAYNREESADQIVAIAAPIFDFRGAVDAAVVVSLPAARFDAEADRRIRAALGEAARAISQKLGSRGGSEGQVQPGSKAR